MSAWGKANGVTGDDIVCDPSLQFLPIPPKINRGPADALGELGVGVGEEELKKKRHESVN
jgi:hypothetical protein